MSTDETAADFNRWARYSYWSVDEAAALLLGKDPRWVKGMKPSTLRDQLNELAELMRRAQVVGKLSKPITPPRLIKWVRASMIELPIGLEGAVSSLPRSAPSSPAELDTRRRTSLQTLILCWALTLGHRPDASRNLTVPLMRAALKRFGMNLGDDTIRDIVSEAAEEVEYTIDEE